MRDLAIAGDTAQYASQERTGGRVPAERPVMPVIDVLLLDGPASALGRISARFTVRMVDGSPAPSPGRCLLVIALALDRPEVRARLQQLRRQRPATPLVLITSGDAANLRRLVGLNADEVVTVERVEDDLTSVVRSLVSRSPLEAAAAAFEAADSLDPIARAAILAALRSVPPLHTVKALARQLGLPRKRLWRGLRVIRIRTGWSCLDLLHAAALWRVVELARGSGITVQQAWQALELSDSTARRVCRAHLACAPSELLDRADALERAILDFVDRCLAHGQ